MGKKKETSQAIDFLLYGLAFGTISTMFVAPNAGIMIEKPLEKLLDGLDERQKARELSRLRSYMKTQGLVRGDYDHAIEITAKGRRRIKNYKYENLSVPVPEKWSHTWSLVMFDIPEQKRDARISFTQKLNEMGFQLLQQSVWIHPFQAKDEIYAVSKFLGIDEWVSYIETTHIDNAKKLENRFKHLLVRCI